MSPNKRKLEADTTGPGSAKKRQPTPTKMVIDLTRSSLPPSPSPSPAAYTDGLRTSALVTTPASPPHSPIYEYKVIFTFTEDERVEETVVGVFTSVEMANKAGRRALEEKGSFSESDVQFVEDGLFYVEETPLKDLDGCCYGRIEIIKRAKRAKKTKKAKEVGQI